MKTYLEAKAYLEPNNTIAFLVEWGGLVLFLALVLAPFLIIRHRLFRPTRIWHIVGAYAGSFGVFIVLMWVAGKIDEWLLNNFINTGWIQEASDWSILKNWLLLLFTWPLSIFYATITLPQY